MARQGDTIEYANGDKIVFRKTTTDTEGQLLEFDAYIQPGSGPGKWEHLHPTFEERFEIISGIVWFSISEQQYVTNTGDILYIPANAWHTFKNVGSDVAHIRVTIEPGQKAEAMLETYFALARAGKINRATGMPGLLQLSVSLSAFKDEIRLPFAVHLATFVLAPIGRLLGYRAQYLYPYEIHRYEAEEWITAYSS